MQSNDAKFLARAIRLAERGLFTTHPNPRVGSVIVRDGEIVGEGFHEQAGGPHAEAAALAQAGERARGATVYCTLEPCSYEGRTPSCAKSLVEAGVARVVCAMLDPHPRNSGAGFRILEAAGITVEYPLMESSAASLNPGHVKRFRTGLPYVRLKLGMSLDGRTALANGESQWITSIEARRDVQKLRARSSAIVTGVQTVNDDNPQLNVREAGLMTKNAALASSIRRPVFVLDSNGRVDPGADLLDNPDCVLVSTIDHDVHGRAERLRLPPNAEGRVSLRAVLEELARRECNEVLFECGPTLGASVIRGGYADEVVVYAAPVMLGTDARGLLRLPKIDNMRDRTEFEFGDIRRIGPDLRITLMPQGRPDS